MIMSNFLRNRKSVREFKKKEVNFDILDDINKDLRVAEDEVELGKIKFKLYENGKNVSSNLKDKGGYDGVMINSPHYLVLIRQDDEENTIVRSGYYMEKVITSLNNKGLSTCWVSIKDVNVDLKKEIFGDCKGTIDYILAFGYEKLKNPFNTEVSSERIGVSEYVFDREIERKASTDDLESKGLLDIFYYLRFAPSTKNLQPWRFLMEDGNLKLLLAYEDWNQSFLVDAGIIMYYFEALAETQRLGGEWTLFKTPSEDYKTDKFNYKSIAEYKL
ncbi:MAG TPA: nitroreductase family protein [Tissierellaceae bacterium]|nr:nitroreductase family protein [Tissierellaceae bacterium]